MDLPLAHGPNGPAVPPRNQTGRLCLKRPPLFVSSFFVSLLPGLPAAIIRLPHSGLGLGGAQAPRELEEEGAFGSDL